MAKRFYCALPHGGYLLLESDPVRVYMDRLPKGKKALQPREPEGVRHCTCGLALEESVRGWEWLSGDEEPHFITRYRQCRCGAVWLHDGISGLIQESHLNENEIAIFVTSIAPVADYIHLDYCRSCREQVVSLVETLRSLPREFPQAPSEALPPELR